MKSQGISFQTKSGHPVICVKSFQNWTRGFGGVVVFKSIVNGRQTKTDHKSSPCHYVTGELTSWHKW